MRKKVLHLNFLYFFNFLFFFIINFLVVSIYFTSNSFCLLMRFRARNPSQKDKHFDLEIFLFLAFFRPMVAWAVIVFFL